MVRFMTRLNNHDLLSVLAQEYIYEWHGVRPPNDLSVSLLEEHSMLISAFEKLRGQMQIIDEPMVFERALVNLAEIEVIE